MTYQIWKHYSQTCSHYSDLLWGEFKTEIEAKEDAKNYLLDSNPEIEDSDLDNLDALDYSLIIVNSADYDSEDLEIDMPKHSQVNQRKITSTD